MDEEGKIPHSKLYIFLNFFTITASIVIIYIVFVGDNSSNALKSYEALNTLEFAIIAFRHGARSPVLTFPTDKSEWPEGRLTLTSKGKSQMFKRGQTLRARYGNFFNNTFCQEDFLIRTTNSSRTRMSLEILLSGMFPADPQRPGNWQPVDLQIDNFDKSAIVINPEKCPKYGTEQHDAIQFDEYREVNRDFISFLVKETGLLINDPLDMLVIWDVINCSEETGYILPDWATKNVTNKLFDEIDKMMNSFVASTPRATTFVEGPLIHYFNNWLTLKSSGNATEKILMHSGHDFTLLSLLSAVGFKHISNVPFASVLVFEVHKVHQSRQVKLLFYNSTANYENSEDILVEPIHLDMPSCSGKCTLDNFQSLLSKFEIDENTWQERCHEQ